MKNKSMEGLLLILLGFIIIGCGLYIYFVANTIYPDSESSRVHRLNWLLKHLGKTGTAILFSIVGTMPIIAGIKNLKSK